MQSRGFKKFFYIEPLEVEEFGVHFFDQLDESMVGSVNRWRIGEPTSKFKFSAFLDGTMRVYKVASAIGGVPLYIAPIACAVIERDNNRQLKNTCYTRFLNVVLFPLKSYIGWLERNKSGFNLTENEIRSFENEFVERLDVAAKSNFHGKLFREQLLHQNKKVDDIFGRSGNWIFCDTSHYGLEEIKKLLIPEQDLLNQARVKEVARTRARFIMILLEFFCGIQYLRDNKNKFLLVDGVIPTFSKVGGIFRIDRREFYLINKNIVGFIKHPRKVPQEVIASLPFLTDNECLVWKSRQTGEDFEDFRQSSDSDLIIHAILRLRNPQSEFYPSTVGVIKIQSGEEEEFRELVKAVWQERNPWPSDRRRIYCELFPIEVAEKVANSLMPSEGRITGFLRSIMATI